jgi:chromosome segregation ATPase
VTDLDNRMILFYTSAKAVSPSVKEALADVLERKRELARLAQERSRREDEIKVVGQEQDRIRQNMAQLDRASDLYTRYVQKFAAQEDRVETLRGELAELREKEQTARRDLDEMLSKLEVE